MIESIVCGLIVGMLVIVLGLETGRSGGHQPKHREVGNPPKGGSNIARPNK